LYFGVWLAAMAAASSVQKVSWYQQAKKSGQRQRPAQAQHPAERQPKPDKVVASTVSVTTPQCRRIQLVLAGAWRKVQKKYKLPPQSDPCSAYGSTRNGFATPGSDLDVNINIPNNTDIAMTEILKTFADEIEAWETFDNVTRIFAARVPVMKLTDRKSQCQVDVCFNNLLAVKNTELLNIYQQIDPRVGQLGCLIKDWAKREDVVGVADGFLSSYAYLLLVIHFLQQREPAILPNLQELAASLGSKAEVVEDTKWGFTQECDTRFCRDVRLAKETLWQRNRELGFRKESKETIEELCIGFFRFYSSATHRAQNEVDPELSEQHERSFNWARQVVSIRLARQCQRSVAKKAPDGTCNPDLRVTAGPSGALIEDPFDCHHNLAEKCSEGTLQEILDRMHHTAEVLSRTPGLTGPRAILSKFGGEEKKWYLKCKVDSSANRDSFWKFFYYSNRVDEVYYPASGSGFAFLEFSSLEAMREAHSDNQRLLPESSFRLNLHLSTRMGLKLEQQKSKLEALVVREPHSHEYMRQQYRQKWQYVKSCQWFIAGKRHPMSKAPICELTLLEWDEMERNNAAQRRRLLPPAAQRAASAASVGTGEVVPYQQFGSPQGPSFVDHLQKVQSSRVGEASPPQQQKQQKQPDTSNSGVARRAAPPESSTQSQTVSLPLVVDSNTDRSALDAVQPVLLDMLEKFPKQPHPKPPPSDLTKAKSSAQFRIQVEISKEDLQRHQYVEMKQMFKQIASLYPGSPGPRGPDQHGVAVH